jgi:hypothetical protein
MLAHDQDRPFRVIRGEVTMFRDVTFVWIMVIVAQNALRLYCASIVQSQNPALYRALGQPGVIGWPSWGFVYKATRPAHIVQVSAPARYSLRAAQILDVLAILLTAYYAVLLFRLQQHAGLWGST